MMRWKGDAESVRPMLASTGEPPLMLRGWVYEPKYDGIRALAFVVPEGGGREATVTLYSRNGHEKHRQFPAIARALAALGERLPHPVMIDGEIVAIDAGGRPLGFQQIQGRIGLTSPAEIGRAESAQPAAYIMFDLLRDGDEDLRPLPLAARRLRLHERIRPPRRLARLLRLSEVCADDGRALLRRAEQEGWEGLIAKDAASVYLSGKRTPAWRKLKIVSAQEFVIGGWTEPRQTRQHFGALLLGYYDSQGHLHYAGNVGTGFDQRELDRVAGLLAARTIDRSPFVGPVRTLERPHWTRPDQVAEVRFTEWTADGLLRHPVYLGLRTDKPARDVYRDPLRGDRVASRLPASPRSMRIEGTTMPEKRTTRARSGAKATRRTSKSDPPPARRRRAERPTTAALAALVERLRALEDARKDGELELPNGDQLRVTNLAKLFWPALRITKGDLLRFYVEVAPLILPTVDDRPLVMRRFPNGVGHSAFYQQRHPETPPAGVRREVLPPEIEPIDEEGPRDRLIGGSLTTLLYMTQLASISQDPWFSSVKTAPYQDFAAIDLDPGDGVEFGRVLDVARWVKDELDRHGIPAVPKTSGASGLHIYVKLPPRTTYETGQLLCQVVATAVATKHPAQATVERMVKRRRAGTVYVDYLQNILGKTLATAYSARASDYAGVSTPLRWTEVAKGIDPRDFTIRTAPARFRQVGDLWSPVRTGAAVDLKAVIARATRA
jgi:bifunctional non-homologous end joining protein LigD